MSTETPNSQSSGPKRPRRSRGGQNRNRNNNNSNREGGERKTQGGGNRNGRQQGGGNRSRRRPMPTPKLSFWQKLLKAIGLYTPPARPPRKQKSEKQNQESKAPRGKTRDARTDQKSSNDRPKRNVRKQREERSDRPERAKRDGNRPRGGDPSTVESRRVYVGNLSYDATESDLEELFKGVGAVRKVEIVYNRSTHRSKGYGFIEMIDVDEAKRTVEVLHDQFFLGRQITVSGAKTKVHEEAENEESQNEKANKEMPPLAPKGSIKDEAHNIVAEPAKAEAPDEEPAKAPVEAPAETAPTEPVSTPDDGVAAPEEKPSI